MSPPPPLSSGFTETKVCQLFECRTRLTCLCMFRTWCSVDPQDLLNEGKEGGRRGPGEQGKLLFQFPFCCCCPNKKQHRGEGAMAGYSLLLRQHQGGGNLKHPLKSHPESRAKGRECLPRETSPLCAYIVQGPSSGNGTAHLQAWPSPRQLRQFTSSPS